MRKPWWMGISGLLLAAGPASAGPGIAHDDTIYPDDLLEAAPARRVDVRITDRGPEPRNIAVNGAERLQLVLTRESEKSCRGEVLVPELDARTSVPSGSPVVLDLLVHARGRIHLSCPTEDVGGSL